MRLIKQPNANGGANKRIYDAIEKWYVENLVSYLRPIPARRLKKIPNPIYGTQVFASTSTRKADSKTSIGN